MDERELRKQMMEMSSDEQRAEMVREFKKALVLGGLLAAKKYPTCAVHETEMEWVASAAHPEGGAWVCEDCRQEEEAILQGTGEREPMGVIAGSLKGKSREELAAAAMEFETQLRAMYALGAVRGVDVDGQLRHLRGDDTGRARVEYVHPTKKVKAESKKRREMAKASRRKNRR